jgi:NAD(P)-dependent dehydrogenase (short-subunit alcohol dehydrogenase family)
MSTAPWSSVIRFTRPLTGPGRSQVILALRNTEKGKATAQPMTRDVEVRRLDLQDLSSVQDFADGVDTVDVLVNNAGIMATKYALTADGFEGQIGTNHLGHFALTNLLLPKLTDRVVTVSSLLHMIGYISLKDLNWQSRRYSAWLAYGQSKLANLLFTSELQRRLDTVGSALRALAAHRGYSRTNLQGHSGCKLGDAVISFVTHVVFTDAYFGARQTLYAASQDLPGNASSARDSACMVAPSRPGATGWPSAQPPPPHFGSCPSSSPYQIPL